MSSTKGDNRSLCVFGIHSVKLRLFQHVQLTLCQNMELKVFDGAIQTGFQNAMRSLFCVAICYADIEYFVQIRRTDGACSPSSVKSSNRNLSARFKFTFRREGAAQKQLSAHLIRRAGALPCSFSHCQVPEFSPS
jgi:hypothetical protein